MNTSKETDIKAHQPRCVKFKTLRVTPWVLRLGTNDHTRNQGLLYLSVMRNRKLPVTGGRVRVRVERELRKADHDGEPQQGVEQGRNPRMTNNEGATLDR